MSAFDWDHPAVEQFVDGHALLTEVIDHEGSAVDSAVQRCLADSRGGVQLQFQFIHGQFPAGDDGGAFDANPAAVDIL